MVHSAQAIGIAALALLASVAVARAGENEVRAAQGTIEAQLQAFLGNRTAEAYSYAAPNIQRLFPTVKDFMAMVENGYQPVMRPRSFAMGPVMSDSGTRIAQKVILTGPDGKTWEALYTLERQPDGQFRITGVSLREGRFTGA